MKGQRLSRGMQLKFAGQRYSIEKRLADDELQLKHIATEALTAKPEKEILKALFEGAAELLGTNGEAEVLLARRHWASVNDFEALDESDPRKREALRRLKYIEAVRKARLTDFGKNSHRLKPIIERVSSQIRDGNMPSCVTLARWNKVYTGSGDDIRSLPPAFKARGRAKRHDRRRISKDLQACNAVDRIIDEVINEHYLQKTRPTAQATYELIVARIAQENRFRDLDEQLPTPHRNTLYRKIDRLDAYVKDKARFSKRIADLRHKVNKQGVRPTRPLERVEIDDTKLDLFVIDEKTNLPIGRPWLMVAICVYTKMILGYYLSFTRPSYLSVMQTLLHSIRPKTYVRERYPEIVHSWDAYGLPESVVVDNAKQYYSASFDEACLQLGIITQYAPVKHPYYKPSIERVFGTLNTRLLHQMPGTTFSNVAQKWDYDPKKNAIISMQTLERVIHTFIVDVYHQDLHRGIDDIPARRWEIGIKDFPPALPFNAEELNVLLGHIEHRSISSSGVEMWGLYYNDLSLSQIKSHTKKGDTVKIKYDPTDISLIHVYDQISNRYIPIPAVAQEYTRGLSLWQHKVIKREARLAVKDYVDIEELCLAKERIQKIIDREFSERSKTSASVKAALWQNSNIGANGVLDISDDAANGASSSADNQLTRYLPEQNSTDCISPAEANSAPNAENKGPAFEKPCTGKHTLSNKQDCEIPADQPRSEHSQSTAQLPAETDIDLTEIDSDYDLPRRQQ
jgi:putative transposase